MKINITDKFVKSLKSSEKNQRFLDIQLLGFGVVVTPKNSKSFFYRYYFEKKEKLKKSINKLWKQQQ